MTIFRSGLLAASIIALSGGSALADYELNILHINDLHSRIEAINKFDSTCSAEEEGKGECFGGVARLKAAIAQIPNVAQSPVPEINLLDFKLEGAVIAVRPYTHTDHYWQVYFDTNEAIARVGQEAGWPVPAAHHKVVQA